MNPALPGPSIAPAAPVAPTPGAFVARTDAMQLLDAVRRSPRSAGVVHLDLDRFHQVNTQWGHQVGDLVLAVLGPRLAACLPAGGVVCSTDGDAFVAVVPDADWWFTTSVAERMLQAVAAPIGLDDGDAVAVRASAGIAWKADHEPADDQPIDLLEHAYLACRRAKATAPGTVVGYEYSLGEQAVRRQRIEDGLRRAIAQDELRLFVQPEVDLRDGRVVGVEALVRWQHPDEGLLAPAAFLPDAEAAGLMTALGGWVLDAAIDLAERWREAYRGDPVRVWVNLAAQQLTDGEEVRSRVAAAIDAGRITHRCIGFEVTESSLLDDLPAATSALMELRRLGIEIALDDFGTGYSSLSYLRRLPVTAVKIDRSFVQGVGDSLTDEAIIEAVIDLSHALGLRVIAEGVEDVGQARSLVRMGADHAQGYHFGRPVPPDEVEESLVLPWCGKEGPLLEPDDDVRRAEELPGFGSPRARLLMAALDSAHDAVVVTSASGGDAVSPPIVYVNDAFESQTGLRSRDVLGRSIVSLLPDDSSDDVLHWFTEIRSTATSATRELPARRADGSSFLCELTMSPITDERGVHTHWLHVWRDLSKRLEAENDRRRFQGLIEQTTSLVFIVEQGGRWVYANAAMRECVGLAPDDSLDGISIEDVIDPDDGALIEYVVLPALREARVWEGETVFVNRRTGARTEVEADVQYVDDPLRPGVKFFAAVCRDVTEEHRVAAATRRRRSLGDFAARVAQSALDQTRDEFLSGLDVLMSDLGELLGADFAFLDSIDLERNMLRPLGLWISRGSPQRQPPPPEVSLDRLTHWVAHLGRLSGVSRSWRSGDAPWSRELRDAFPGDQGGSALVTPLRVGGVLLGVLGVACDDDTREWGDLEHETIQQLADTLANLLARLRDADALQASETRLGAMLAAVRDVLLVIDRDGWIRYVNQSLWTALGRRPADVLDQHFLGLVHPDDRDRALNAFSMQLEGRQPPSVELRVLHADGSSVWFDVDSSDLDDPLVGGFMISLRDVSARHESQVAATRTSEFERVVLALSQWALEVQPDDVYRGLDRQLELLGRTLGTDAAFVALLDGDHIQNVAGWSIDRSASGYELPVGRSELPALVARYRSLEPLIVDDIDAHSGAWVDEWRSFPVSDRSGLNVPLVSGGRCLGNLGVAMAAEPRVWMADEIALVQRVAGTVSALIARVQVEASLRQSENRLAALLDGSHDVVVVVDDDGTIWFANGAVQRSLGYEPAAMLGRNVAEFVHPNDLELAIRRLTTLWADHPTPITIIRLRGADGEMRSWEVTSGDLRDPIAGGRVLTCRDVTSRLEDEQAAARWVELLRFAFDLAQTALDVDTDQFIDRLSVVCADVAALLEVDLVYVDQLDEHRRVIDNLGGWVRRGCASSTHPGAPVAFASMPSWLDRLRSNDPVVAGDLAEVGAAWVDEKRAVFGGERAMVAVPMTSAGELMGVLGASMVGEPRAWHDDEITFLRIVTETIAHVLERSRLDEALRASESRFRLLAETAADVIILVGLDGRFTYVSPSSASLLGIPSSDLIGTPAEDLIHPDDRANGWENVPIILRRGWATSEMRIRRADGSYIWVANSTSGVRDPDTGEIVQFRASVRDISDRKRLEAELEHQALHDPLTGLANRILLQRRLDIAAEDGSADLAVLLLDLDGFKQVNDTHGHALGDEVLRIIGARLRHLARPHDTLARTGGDEFVLLCPNTSEVEAVRIAQRFVDAIGRPIAVGKVQVQLGVSIGVAHQDGRLADSDALLLEADRAMYAAKRSGRSRVGIGPDRVIA
ncbi:MAG: PAS domain S-box protein [Acidimicrobiales bacterium]